jgi:hypothetical protein
MPADISQDAPPTAAPEWTQAAPAEEPKKLSAVLLEMAVSLPPETISVRELAERIGERGMLAFCLFLNLPFLLPVSVPGVSTVFGALVALVGAGVMLNRLPWMPERLVKRRIARDQVVRTLEHGSRFVAKLEKLAHPRLTLLAQGAAIERWNGFVLLGAGLLLMAPFGLVPFSNTLPALAACFVIIGILERDGAMILLGYASVVGTIIYFGALIAGAGFGLHGLIK